MISARTIKDLGKELNIEVRVASAAFFEEAALRIKQQVSEGLFHNPKHWDAEGIADFCDVRSVLVSANSVIASCLGYLTSDEPNPTSPGKPHGVIARYTRRNYYKELRKRLLKLGKVLRRQYKAKTVAYSCGWVAEKPIAQRSGIGYYGKHSIIINKTYGSWIVLGEVITDLEIEPDETLDIDCGKCGKCIAACPTKAIIRPYVIDRRRCIQALTNFTGIIPDDIADVWGDRVYGCTECQEACPVNKKIGPAAPQTEIGAVGQYLPLLDILEVDEKKFRKIYADNQISASWVNFSAIKRNALFCLGNIKDAKTVPVIRKYAKGSDLLLARAAQWALEKFSSS